MLTKHGATPPRPIPVTTRSHRRLVKSKAHGVAIVHIEKSSPEAIRNCFRPHRSAQGPISRAPMRKPQDEPEKIAPSCVGSKCRSGIINGAVTPIACEIETIQQRNKETDSNDPNLIGTQASVD